MERQERRKTILFAVLLVWALVSTGILAWFVFRPEGPTQSEIWAADAKTLGRLETDFGFMVLDTGEYLITNETNWTWNAVNWAYLSYATVSDAVAGPGGFPSGDPLGFNATAMCVAKYGYNWLNNEAHGPGYQTAHSAAAIQLGLYQNLSARLSPIRGGWTPSDDPLIVIGASNVTAIRSLMTALWSANMDVGFGSRPLVSQECGI